MGVGGWPTRWKTIEVDRGEWLYAKAERLSSIKAEERQIERAWKIRFERVMGLLKDDYEEALRFSSAHNAKVASDEGKKMPRGGRHQKKRDCKNILLPKM